MSGKNKTLFVLIAVLLSMLAGATGTTAGQLAQQKSLPSQPPPPSKPVDPGQMRIESSPMAQVGSGFTYQGRLVVGGNPASGSYDFTYNLYDTSSGGNQVGSTITVLSQTLSIGTFSAVLDFGSFAFQGDNRWLQIGVRPSGEPTYTILAPRQALTPAPYALSLRPGAVISGTALTGLKVTTTGSTALYADGSSYGLQAESDYMGAYVHSTGFYGIEASTSLSNSLALYILNTGYNGYGVYANSSGNNGYGVYGNSSVTNGYGVIGSGFYGVYGSGNRGVTANGSNFGLYATSSNIGASINGATYGLYATATDTDSIGVYAYDGGYSADAMEGTANYSNGTGVAGYGHLGVYGYSSGGYGLYGYGGSGDGIYATGSGYAGYFAGNVNVTGSCCAAGAGTYKIDDPADPTNKYLNQSAVESPDMMDIYNGNATLDQKGEAWVDMPSWFQALNQDFRYQLTSVGAPGPNLYIAEKIKDNRFKIAGGAPGSEVSWQVTGIRQDPYAQQHPITVEEDKSGDARGKYLYPAAYGQPDTMGVDYGKNPLPSTPRQTQKPQPAQPVQLPPAPQLPAQP